MKVLITGANGFIGSHFADALVRRGIQVRCLVRKTGDLRWLDGLDVEYARGDCRDKSSITDAVKGVDQVFHLAGATRAKNDEAFFTANAQTTENLIRACLEHNPGLKKFVFVSSQSAAGPGRNGLPKTESDPCEPVSSYGKSKRRAEELALAHRGRIPVTVLRPSAVYGPRDRDFLSLFKLLTGKIRPCLCSRDRKISLCHVQDLVQALLLVAQRDTLSGEIFFISDGNSYRTEEMAETFSRILMVKPIRIPVPDWSIIIMVVFFEGLSRLTGKDCLLNKSKVQDILQDNWVCDITKAQTVLGFAPRINLDLGTQLTVDWYRQQKWL